MKLGENEWNAPVISRNKPAVNSERLERYQNAGFVEKVRQFLRVTAGPKVGESVYQERVAICRKCPNRQDGDNGQWCGVCGCGNRAAAELTSKLWWARLECPVGYFDAEE